MRVKGRPGERKRGAPRGRERSALLVALLVLVGLSALATAGFLLARTDSPLTDDHPAAVAAFYAADAGLQHFLATRRGIPSDTQSFLLGRATAAVHAVRLTDADPMRHVVLVRSTGRYSTPDGGLASRTVSAVGLVNTATVSVPAALTSGVGILKEGGAGELSGFDAAPREECPVGGQPPRAGVAVPPASYRQTGGEPVPRGSPPVLEDDPDRLLRSTLVDWQEVVNGGALAPDYTVPPDPWPDFGALAPGEWPVIYIDAPYYAVGPTRSGRGTLVVRGDLHLERGFRWEGLLLVGGAITSNGNQTVHGGAITALNLLLGEPASHVDLGTGQKSFRYHSCSVAAAMARLAPIVVEPGTWYERI